VFFLVVNPYPIKWIGLKIQNYGFGFEINSFKWIKSNMNLDNYELDLVIWIFCSPLMNNIRNIYILLIFKKKFLMKYL